MTKRPGALVFGTLLLAACGSSGSNPCRPPEANFSVQGTTGTPFRVVEFVTADGAHHLFAPASGDPLAPHTFYLLNAMWPIVGSFARSAAATEPVPVFVRSPDVNSGDVLSTAVIPIDSDSPVTLSTGAAPIDCPVRRVAPELRVEVFSNIGLFNVPFTLTVGDVTGAFLACGLNRVCGTPTTIYYDNAQQSFDAIVTKNVADDQVINLQLYVDGVLRDSDHATQDDLTAKVHFDL